VLHITSTPNLLALALSRCEPVAAALTHPMQNIREFCQVTATPAPAMDP